MDYCSDYNITPEILFGVEVEGEVGVESNAPFAIVRTSDMPNIQQEDSLSISGSTYIVVDVQPDAEGITDLRLS